MDAASLTWFLVITGWTAGGVPAKLVSEPIYGPEKVCEQRVQFDVPIVATKWSLLSATGKCIPVAPKPAGLPEVQPHVPQRMGDA